MNILSFSRRAIVFDSEETINKVVSKMMQTETEEVVITEKGIYKGMVFAKDLIKRKITNPEKSKIKNLVHSVPLFDSKVKLEEILKSIMGDYPSIPIKVDKDFFVVGRTDILGYVKNHPLFKKKTAGDIMLDPIYVSSDDTLLTSVSIARDSGVSRLLVVNKKGKIEGMLTPFELLRICIERERISSGGASGEKIKLGEVVVSSLMKKNILTATPETKIREIIEMMQKNKISTIVIEKDRNPIGIITPRIILKLALKEAPRIYTRISGIEEEDPFIKSIVKKEIERTMTKIERFWPISYFVVNVAKHRKEGKKRMYSVKGRLVTKKGMFNAESNEWDLTKAIKNILDIIEREVIKKKEMKRN